MPSTLETLETLSANTKTGLHTCLELNLSMVCKFKMWHYLHYYFALVWLRNIVMSISVCVSVHSYNSKTMQPNFTNFLMHVACGIGLILL